MTKKALGTILVKIFFLVFFAFLLIRTTDFSELYLIFIKTNFSTFLYSFLCKLFGILSSVFVLFYSLKLLGVTAKIKELTKIYFLSYFFNNLGLGSLGGDSYKWVQINSFISSKLKTTYALVSEKIIGMAVLTSFAIISFAMHFLQSYTLYYYVLVLPLSLLIIICTSKMCRLFTSLNFLNKNKLITEISNIHVSFNWQNTGIFFRAACFTILFYLSAILSFFVICKSVDPSLPIFLPFFVIPIIIFVNAVPISFQGLGIREASIAFLFTYLGYSFEMGVAASLILLIVNLAINLFSGLYYLLTLFGKEKRL